jgi:uncharacterized MAPEG superfamily protein
MSHSLLALLGYAAWTLLLLTAIAALRTTLVLQRKRRANAFSPAGDDVSPFSGRLCRAHANCVENLPVFAAIVIAASIAGRGDITDPLALWVLAARIGQSTVHLWSLSRRAITWRFGFLVAQVLVLVWWVGRLVMAAA